MTPAVSRLTERLRLDRPTFADVTAHYEIHGDPETHRFNPAGPLASPADSEAELSEWAAHWEEHGFGYWTVRTRADGQVIGFGGVVYRDYGHGVMLNLYYRFRPSAWGRGLAQEMAREAIVLAAETVSGAPVVAVINPANTPSVRVAEQVGLRLDGMIPLARGSRALYRLHSARTAPGEAGMRGD
ncbi:GNAT family N-acetyltransferase [Nonomuraea sp. NPDC002799]